MSDQVVSFVLAVVSFVFLVRAAVLKKVPTQVGDVSINTNSAMFYLFVVIWASVFLVFAVSCALTALGISVRLVPWAG